MSETTTEVAIKAETRKRLGEPIPGDTLHAVIDRYASFYHLPTERVKKAKSVTGFYVTKAEYHNVIDQAEKEEFEWQLEMMRVHRPPYSSPDYFEWSGQYKSIQADLETPMTTEKRDRDFLEFRGQSIQRRDGSRILIIDKTLPEDERRKVIDHEVLHDLARSDYKTGGGFKHFDPRNGSYKNGRLDEGATELLRAFEQYADLSTVDVLSNLAFRPNQFPVYYPKDVKCLVGILSATHHEGGTPFSSQDLATHYFNQDRSMIDDPMPAFLDDLTRRTPPKYQPINAEYLKGN